MLKWKQRVYHLPIKEKLKIKSKHWITLRRKVFKRDKFQCQKCKEFFGENGLFLEAHHIIPRPKGKTIMNNLISLCVKCHDFVEINGFDFDIPELKVVAKVSNWHKWVYDGYAKPE